LSLVFFCHKLPLFVPRDSCCGRQRRGRRGEEGKRGGEKRKTRESREREEWRARAVEKEDSGWPWWKRWSVRALLSSYFSCLDRSRPAQAKWCATRGKKCRLQKALLCSSRAV